MAVYSFRRPDTCLILLVSNIGQVSAYVGLVLLVLFARLKHLEVEMRMRSSTTSSTIEVVDNIVRHLNPVSNTTSPPTPRPPQAESKLYTWTVRDHPCCVWPIRRVRHECDSLFSTTSLPVQSPRATSTPPLPAEVERDYPELEVWPAEGRRIRILCLVISTDDTLMTRSLYMYHAWVRRECDHSIFSTNSADHPHFPAEQIVMGWSREDDGVMRIGEKVGAMWSLATHRYLEQFDFFLMVDSDSFVDMARLRHYLGDKHPDHPWYIGGAPLCLVFANPRFPYLSLFGGHGYVFSRGALARISHVKSYRCRFYKSYVLLGGHGLAGDADDGHCAALAGIIPHTPVHPVSGHWLFKASRNAHIYYRSRVGWWAMTWLPNDEFMSEADGEDFLALHRVTNRGQLVYSLHLNK